MVYIYMAVWYARCDDVPDFCEDEPQINFAGCLQTSRIAIGGKKHKGSTVLAMANWLVVWNHGIL